MSLARVLHVEVEYLSTSPLYALCLGVVDHTTPYSEMAKVDHVLGTWAKTRAEAGSSNISVTLFKTKVLRERS